MKNSFKKAERLNSKKLIKELFDKGSSFYLYPFKVIYLSNTSEAPISQILISVSKRNFKKAVDRNKIKRRVREAYRLNKSQLNITQSISIAYIYTPKEILSFQEIQNKIVTSLHKLTTLNINE
jgi:ribonuclease P protein component